MVDAPTASDQGATVDKIAEAKQKRKPKPKPAQEKARQPFFYELSRLMVISVDVGTKKLAYKAQTKPNGPWQANWTPIDSTQLYYLFAAGTTGDGRVAVVAQASPPTALFYIDEKPDTPTEQWNPPVSLGKPAGTPAFVSLAMAVDADGRVEVFGTSSNNQQIWWKYQNPNRIVQKTVTRTPPGTNTPITVTVNEIEPPATPWSDWMQIPGGLTQITALRNADGRIILFGLNAQNHLYRTEQKVAQALQPSDWSGWIQMDDKATDTFSVMAPALDSAGAVNFFGINKGGQVLHTRQSPPCTSTWTGWTTPGLVASGFHMLAAGTDGDDHLVLVASDKSNSKFHNLNAQLDVEMQQWSGWIPISVGDPTQLALDYNSDGRLTLFSYLGSGGHLYCISQMAYSSTQWEWEWTWLGSKIHQFAVVRDPTPPASAFQ